VSVLARLALAAPLVLCACHGADYLSFTGDDRKVLCSASYDDMSQEAPWGLIEDEIQQAADARRIVMFHAHKPGVTVSIGAIERMLSLADKYGLDYVEFKDLVPGNKRAGIALAFDDNDVEGWLDIRDLLQEHHAQVTFFVCRYALLDDDEHHGIDLLASDGHDIEPHTVNHLHAHEYVKQHGIDQYMTDEVLPSLQVLTDAGYPPTSFAYPFGERSDELDTEILKHVDRVRTTPGECPW